PGDHDVLLPGGGGTVDAPSEAGEDARREVGVHVGGEIGGTVKDGPHELGEDAAGGVGGPSRRGPWRGHEGAAVDGASVDAEGVVADGAADEAAAEEVVRGPAVAGRRLMRPVGVHGGGNVEVEVGGGASLEDEGVAVDDAHGALGVAMERE